MLLGDNEDILAVLKDVALLCRSDAATLRLGGAHVASYPTDVPDGTFETACKWFDGPEGKRAALAVHSKQRSALTDVQDCALHAMTLHACCALGWTPPFALDDFERVHPGVHLETRPVLPLAT